jgi:hypothetical protein
MVQQTEHVTVISLTSQCYVFEYGTPQLLEMFLVFVADVFLLTWGEAQEIMPATGLQGQVCSYVPMGANGWEVKLATSLMMF